MTTRAPLAPELERLARKRVHARLGLYSHALVYVLVVGTLGLLALGQGRAWAFWPAAGWGIGLVMHGLGVFGFGPGNRLRDSLLAREREHLRPRG